MPPNYYDGKSPDRSIVHILLTFSTHAVHYLKKILIGMHAYLGWNEVWTKHVGWACT